MGAKFPPEASGHRNRRSGVKLQNSQSVKCSVNTCIAVQSALTHCYYKLRKDFLTIEFELGIANTILHQVNSRLAERQLLLESMQTELQKTSILTEDEILKDV
ncbi:hypothetical protein EB796_010269 [Bugula neritina]|uniref:Uncharacterized protein n=1 Tax=Bugula neritina TaxID=10212 RepID=A0A7J7JZN5_BUGNE|nr:hypothetical protein EB796_010269 [Bugula neritina]